MTLGRRRYTFGGVDLGRLSDPDADSLFFWDESVNQVSWLTLGSGLSFTDTTLSVVDGDIDHGSLTGLDDADHNAVYYTETEIDAFTVKYNDFASDVYTFNTAGITLTAGRLTANTVGTGITWVDTYLGLYDSGTEAGTWLQIEALDNADPSLEASTQSLRHHVRGPNATTH